MSTYYSPKIVTDGLLWCMDWEAVQSWRSGSDYWYDKVNRFPFTVSGSHSSFDSQGRIVWDGSTDINQLSAGIPISNVSAQWTLQYWWRKDGDSGGAANAYHQIMSSFNGGSITTVLILNANNLVNFRSTIDGKSVYVGSTTDVNHPVGTWHHYTLARNTTEGMKMYQDGNLRIDGATCPDYTGSISTGATPTILGRDSNYIPNGALGLILLYDRVLTDAEIYNNYLTSKNRFS